MIRITVTKEDINNVETGSSSTCAIAKALQRRFPKSYISVGITNCHISGNKYIPYSVKKFSTFINDFNDDKPVKPTKFCLRKVKEKK